MHREHPGVVGAVVAGGEPPALDGERVDDPVVMVGDRPSTDGRFADLVGLPFALVLSGVTSPEAPPTEPAPAYVAADLAALVAQYGGSLA